MPITQTEIDDTVEMFAAQIGNALGPIRTRKMMGGLAIYAHDVTFALYVPDEGYFLKADDVNRGDFDAEGLEPFTFEFTDKETGKIRGGTMNYYALPERCYDDPDERIIWARGALDVALRAKAKKKPKKKKPAKGKPS